MPSRYVMQIVDRSTGEVVQFEPGLVVERMFVDDCVKAAHRKKIGFFRRADVVADRVREAIEETIFELKTRVRP